jgi:uncharacterized repeat protein (TIGR03803 family)
MNMRLPFALMLCVMLNFARAQAPVLWGFSSEMGPDSAGTIFTYNSATHVLGTKFSFSTVVNGRAPLGALIKGSNGLLYGMTNVGVPFNQGSLFSFNILTDSVAVLHAFTDTGGFSPCGSPLLIGDSVLYGLTEIGGSYGAGTIFSNNIITGVYTTLHYFGHAPDGGAPFGSLIQLKNSTLLFGTTSSQGVNGTGTIFSYDMATHVYTKVHDFTANAQDGATPNGDLLQVGDSLLYGLASQSGADGDGVIFTYNFVTGKETVVHNMFSPQGGVPMGSLMMATDSLMYGTTIQGGANAVGVLFSFDPATGVYTDLHNFGSTPVDGQTPGASLIQASDGLLYGTTEFGGAAHLGTI